MARVINGTLSVSTFTPSGNPGEYSIEGAVYNNQTDSTGNGAFDLSIGDILFVPVSDPNSLELVPGVVNRYLVTDIEIIDSVTINAIVVYNQEMPQYDVPADYSVCIISKPSNNLKFGFPVSSAIYPEVSPGIDFASINTDSISITDQLNKKYVFVQSSLSNLWLVHHNKRSENFSFSLFDGDGHLVFPDSIQVVNDNFLKIHLLEPMSGKVVLNFV